MTTETLIAVPASDCYTEAALDDGWIKLHVEDRQNGVDTVYSLEQAEALHRTLGHLLYLANQEA
jgi:hypothetical protein